MNKIIIVALLFIVSLKSFAEESKREYGVVQSKIEAVKKAIEQKKKGI